ncbi:MAG: hypothetical protein ACYSVY_28050, partial [Planctomycetota bacterium]
MIQRWFPELRRFDSRSERREAWAAVHSGVTKSPRYWLIFAATFAVLGVLSGALGSQYTWRWGLSSRWISTLASGFATLVAMVLTLWLVRRRITRNLRVYLNEHGQPTCLRCGYDLTG